jgi:hypothetical protein
VKVPVHLARWPDEPVDAAIAAMYENMLGVLKDSVVGRGDWRLLAPQSATDNQGAQNCVIIQWQNTRKEFDLVTVNLGDHASDCRVKPEWPELSANDWEVRDALGNETRRHHGGDLEAQGLRLELPPHGAQLLKFRPA